MYNKLSSNYQKRHVYNFEDEPPAKKLVSDGDVLIKQLAEKQRKTKVTLHEQLTAPNQFYKSTELLSITNYTSGSVSLEKFKLILQHLTDVEKLKSSGLSNEEITLLQDFQSDALKEKHKNLNQSVFNLKLEEIYNKITNSNNQYTKPLAKTNRLTTETTLATKPLSVETKLLKFALENGHKNKQVIPGPMDQIKDVEKVLVETLAPIDIKKIRKKARSLAKQIEDVGNPILKEPVIKECQTNKDFCTTTKWDIKDCHTENNKLKETKVFTCKPQNYYTIRNGTIVKLGSSLKLEKSDTYEEQRKLSLDEIKKISKFENYEKGTPTRILYLKNLANGIHENDLINVFSDFKKYIQSVNVMKGRMRGQAFIELTDEETAEKALGQVNGIFLKNKPIIIQFGKRKIS